MTPPGRLARIVRHPVKSIGWEDLSDITLAPAACLPGDRAWAVTHAATRFDATAPAWAPKLNFVRGWGSPALMAVRAATLGPDRYRFAHPDRPTIEADLATIAGRAALIDWVRPLWPEVRPDPAQVVRVPGQALTDQPDPLVSVLSLASLAHLGGQIGQDLSIHRFRGNLWLDGLPPWAERDWIGQQIGIGPVRLRVEAHIGRCRATHADPTTGRADIDIMGLLDRTFGHTEFGVFARIEQGGKVALGDPVILP